MEQQYLRINDVCSILAISKATIYRMIKSDDFPAPTHLGQRKSRWLNTTISEWINTQETQSDWARIGFVYIKYRCFLAYLEEKIYYNI